MLRRLSRVSLTCRYRSRLICIDDLERKGKNLRIQDVMGLISYLRERRKCKIVLILNEDELDQAERGDFEKYQEKVIDVSLLFAPNEEDSVKIALGEARVGVLATLGEFCISLGVSNIRIIKKIERLVLQVEPLLSGMQEAVLRQAVQTLTLFGWAHYSKQAGLIDYSLNKLTDPLMGLGGEDKLTEDERKWQGILDAYGFTSVDHLDLALLEGIRAGFFDEERLVRRAQELDQQNKALSSQKDIEAAWRRYRDSFDADDKLVVQGLLDACRKNIDHLSVGGLNSAMRVLKALGQADDAKALLDEFMAKRQEDRAFFDLDAHPFPEELDDPDLRAAFAERLGTLIEKRDPAEILIRIDADKSWSIDDIKTLCTLGAEDFYGIFKKLKAIDLRRAVRASLSLGRNNPNDKDHASITANATEGLKRIAAELNVNKLRVAKWVSVSTSSPRSRTSAARRLEAARRQPLSSARAGPSFGPSERHADRIVPLELAGHEQALGRLLAVVKVMAQRGRDSDQGEACDQEQRARGGSRPFHEDIIE